MSWAWDGSGYVACVTVAGVAGAAVTPGTAQYTALSRRCSTRATAPSPWRCAATVPVTFTVAATITPDPTLADADVLAAVKAALAAAFSFATRAFGQPVFASEVIATMQNVPGVVAMTLNGVRLLRRRVRARRSPACRLRPDARLQGLVGAQLLTLEPGPLPGVVLAS